MSEPHFDGDTYDPDRDHARLSSQYETIMALMSDGEWRTVRQIADLTGYPETSIGSRLRDCRKKKFGAHTMNSVPIGTSGLHTFQVILRKP